MGSSSKGKASLANATAAKTAAPVPTQPAIKTQTFDAFMPGQQGLLAQQMAAGGYGTPEENMGLLARTFSPVSVPILQRPGDLELWMKQAGISPATTSNATPWANSTNSPAQMGANSWAGVNKTMTDYGKRDQNIVRQK